MCNGDVKPAERPTMDDILSNEALKSSVSRKQEK